MKSNKENQFAKAKVGSFTKRAAMKFSCSGGI